MVDDLVGDHCLYLLILTETWHEDSDCIAIKRLSGHRLNVIEAARPISAGTHREDPGFVNHGGLAIVSRDRKSVV